MSLVSKVHSRLDTLVPLRYRSKHVSFGLVLLSAALDNMNVSGTLSVFSSIKEHFDVPTPTASWVLSAYALTLGAFIMLSGKLTDIVGAKKVFVSGVFCSSVFALICACIEDQIVVLIVFRALQGIAASVMMPSMFPIAYSYYSEHGLRTVLISIMCVLSSSNGVGLLIGGAFSLTSVGYKGLFFFTFGVAFTCSVLLYLTMYPVETHKNNKDLSLKALDFPGTIMFVGGIMLVILGLTEGGISWDWPNAYVPIVVGVIVILFGGWFELVYIRNYKTRVTEKNRESLEPVKKRDWRYELMELLPREAFQIPNFVKFICCIILTYISLIGSTSLSVQYYQYIDGDNAFLAALKALTFTAGMAAGPLLNKERLIYKISMKWVLVTSQTSSLGCLVWISFRDYHLKNDYWIFSFVPQFIIGFFLNTFFGIYINAVMRNTPGHLQGVVSGLLQTCVQVGNCLGNALVATMLGVMETGGGPSQVDEYNSRFKRTYYILIGTQAAMVLILTTLKDQKSVEGFTKEEKGEEVDPQLVDQMELQSSKV